MTVRLHPLTDFVTTPGAAVPDITLTDGRALIERYVGLAGELASNPPPSERDRVKQNIIALFRDADTALAEYAAFKESVKSLVGQWKQLSGTPSSSASVAPGSMSSVATLVTPRPTVSVRVDHLGASTFIDKGWSRLSLGDAPGAETALRRALDMTPGDSEAETLLGWAQMLQAQYDLALLTFHTVLLRDPQQALARTNVGYICLRKQLYDEAIEHLSSAIRLDSDKKATLHAHLYLAIVYSERDRHDDAERMFSRTLELGPNLLQAWYEQGRARWFAGKREEANAAWRNGAEANRFNPWGKRCAEILAHVEQGGEPARRD